MGIEVKVSDQEFRTAFNSMRTQAEAHGVDKNDTNINSFIIHESEVMAQLFAEIRKLNNIIHGGISNG